MATPRKIPATIQEVIPHSERIKSLLIVPKQKCPRFYPGQFLHLAIDSYDPSFPWPESRVFSIASSPASELIRVTFAIKGEFTKKMYNCLKPGDKIWIKMPYGDFRFEQTNNKFVFISGGTGITPFISFLDECLDSPNRPEIHLYYGVEKTEHIIFNEILMKNLQINPNFKMSLYVENEVAIPDLSIRQTGRINFEHILTDCALDEEFYLSGPKNMIDFFENLLISNNVIETQIHIDRWQ